MIIATVKEIKDNENRVGLTPLHVPELVQAGHTVLVERGAGLGSFYLDQDYEKAGAQMVDDAEAAFKQADIIVKVKEPVVSEYPLLAYLNGKTLFTYLHLSGVDRQLTVELCKHNVTAIAYETVQDESGGLPLLAPMSQVAGVLAVQYGGQYLQRKYDGRGVTLGKIPNTQKANVMIVGGGHVGRFAALTASGMGAYVKLFDINDNLIEKLKVEFAEYLGANLFKNIQVLNSRTDGFDQAIEEADLLIGGVLVAGKRAPHVVSEAQVKSMKQGAVIVDVSIDQGGCIWGSKPTSHSQPIYELEGKIYCCVTNMPGQVSRQSTQALSAATFPYLLKMTSLGVLEACRADAGLAKGLNTHAGKIRYRAVAEDLEMTDMFEEF